MFLPSARRLPPGFVTLRRFSRQRKAALSFSSSSDKFSSKQPSSTAGLSSHISSEKVLSHLSVGSTAMFAFSGCITAGNSQMDLLGCSLVGAFTALGGGTIRDLLLGATPVGWMKNVKYLWVSLVTSVATFFAWTSMRDAGFTGDNELVTAADSLGVGVACVIGAQAAARTQLSSIVCVTCGVVTSTFGGVIRDVLCLQPARILHSKAEIYASAAMIGSGTFMSLQHFKFTPKVCIGGGISTAVLVRLTAVAFGIKLPSWEKLHAEPYLNFTIGSANVVTTSKEGDVKQAAKGAPALTNVK